MFFGVVLSSRYLSFFFYSKKIKILFWKRILNKYLKKEKEKRKRKIKPNIKQKEKKRKRKKPPDKKMCVMFINMHIPRQDNL